MFETSRGGRRSYAPHLLAIAALWAAAMTADFYEERLAALKTELADTVEWKNAYHNVMIACLNRGAFWAPDTGYAWECEAKALGRSAR